MARKFLRKEKLDKESTSTEKKKHLTVNLIFKSINDFILSSLTKKKCYIVITYFTNDISLTKQNGNLWKQTRHGRFYTALTAKIRLLSKDDTLKTHLSLLVALGRRFVQRTVNVKVERQGARERRLCPNSHFVIAKNVELAVVSPVLVELEV